ncbi:glycosyltransferase [Streptomyces collinus]|uniref:glycosyltransferase n=1 Tax=Streptomyces collinus TaxID=42684 RepID=UPI0033B8C698
MNLHLSGYGAAVGCVLALKLLLSIPRPGRGRKKRRRGHTRAGEQLAVHGVITVYNESPAMLRRCLESLLAQKRPLGSLTVVDDCSATRDAEQVIAGLRPRFHAAGIDVNLIRFPENRGKRHGLAAGFADSPRADVYVCVDSDTVLDEWAVDELLTPFNHRRVTCVTGLVLAHNRAVNLLTRLIDMRYVNAFLGERVAYSRLGSVLCACGSLAAYRGWVARKYVDDFLDQRFLGKPATFGDDRRLTYYCLIEGRSLIQPAAVGWTDVPEKLGHYVRQQIRWGKSFFREGSLLAVRLKYMHRTFWWLNLLELATWVAFTSALLAAMVVIALHPAGWKVLAGYAGYICLMSWVRSLHYLRGAIDIPFLDRIFTFACAPLYALLNLGLLLPLRLYSLATLNRTKWGTRQNGAEITKEEDAPHEVPDADRGIPAHAEAGAQADSFRDHGYVPAPAEMPEPTTPTQSYQSYGGHAPAHAPADAYQQPYDPYTTPVPWHAGPYHQGYGSYGLIPRQPGPDQAWTGYGGEWDAAGYGTGGPEAAHQASSYPDHADFQADTAQRGRAAVVEPTVIWPGSGPRTP